MEGVKQDEQGRFYVEKTVGSTVDVGFDWSTWLDGDTINVGGSSWVKASGPTGGASLAISTQGISTDFLRTVAFLTGGVVGEEYLLHNTITTVGGRTETWAMRVIMKAPL